ncbi:MAG: Uma2 family endonuclease [Bacteroidetes bacterium]|nr:Uma2 family endonuclease [Fibrella sp.]
MITPAETQKLTAAEFHQMDFADDDSHLYELLNGELVKKRAPAPRHQLILAELYDQVKSFAKQHQAGRVLFAPVDVFLDDMTAPQPDLVFVGTDRLNLITSDGIMGVPTLVAEIISPSSIYHDCVIKKGLYERFGVQEYWLIDPADAYIEVFALQTQSGTQQPARYELLSAASVVEGVLTSHVLPGLTLDLVALFA